MKKSFFARFKSSYLILVTGNILLLCQFSLAAAPITLELSPEIQGADSDGQGSFILELTRASLGNRDDFQLVDRTRLKEALDELGLAASGLSSTSSDLQKLGKLVGAQYFCQARTLKSGQNHLISVRVIQVGSSVYKMAVLQIKKDEDLTNTSKTLADKIIEQIAKLEKRPELKQPVPEQLAIPNGSKRPIVAVRILESALNIRSVDPASEIRLLDHLRTSKFKAIQLSQRGQSVQAGEKKLLEGKAFDDLIKEAKAQGVEVVILGEAFSETAGRISRIVYSRARIEVHAIRVSDQKVLHTASAYGAHSDVGDLTAGKKAIEDATDTMCKSFPAHLVKAWNMNSKER